MALTMVTGGPHSGKSRYALALACAHGPRVGYGATLAPVNEEMAAETRRLRAERRDAFVTWETPIEIVELIETRGEYLDALVVDAITDWLGNLVLAGAVDLLEAVDRFAAAAAKSPAMIVAVVEVNSRQGHGQRIVEAQRRLAERAAHLYRMVDGIPERVK